MVLVSLLLGRLLIRQGRVFIRRMRPCFDQAHCALLEVTDKPLLRIANAGLPSRLYLPTLTMLGDKRDAQLPRKEAPEGKNLTDGRL